MDSVFHALLPATQSVNIQCNSLIHLQFLRTSDAKFAKVTNKIASSRFAAVTNKEISDISQIIKQAVSEIHEEGEKLPFGSFNR